MFEPRSRAAHSRAFRVIALVSAFNEADIIGAVIGHLAENGVEVYLLDHGSTDGTPDIAREWIGRGVIEVEPFPPAGDARYGKAAGQYDWTTILLRKEELARSLDADWFIHHDADEIRESPWEGLSLAQALERVDQLAYNVVDFRIFEFPPVNDAFRQGMDPRVHFTHYRDAGTFDQVQLKAWRAQPGPVSLATFAGHDVTFEGKRVFPIPFILRHYPIRSQAHGLRKVFAERKPRFSADERAKLWHIQYDHVADEHHSFLVDPATLRPFDLAEARLDVMVRNREVVALERELGARRSELADLATRDAQGTSESAAVEAVLAAIDQWQQRGTSDVLDALSTLGGALRASDERQAALGAQQASLAAQLTALHDTLVRHLQDLEAARSREQAEQAAHAAEVRDLRAEIETLTASLAERDHTIRELDDRARTAATRQSDLEHLVNAARLTEQDLRGAVASADRQRADMAARADALRADQERASRELQAARVALRHRDAAITESRTRIDQLERQLELAVGELRTIHSSRTWRVGEPIGRFVQSLGIMRTRPDGTVAPMRGDVPTHEPQAAPPAVHGPDHDAAIARASGLFDEIYYRATYPDLADTSIDLARHYCEHGWREGRNPSAGFDTGFYLQQNADIRDGGMNPLLHFIAAGRAEGRQPTPPTTAPGAPAASAAPTPTLTGPMSEAIALEVQAIRDSGLFDEAYYRAMHADIGTKPVDVIRHYCEIGWREGRNPSDDFDTRFYLDTYGDIRNGNMNPFYHYVIAGASELRHALPDMSTRFERDASFRTIETDIRLVAFLANPSWPTVRKGTPRFKGHRQPLLPHESLGFYAQASVETLSVQAALARRHGIQAFAIDLLAPDADRPHAVLETLLETPGITLGFVPVVDLARFSTVHHRALVARAAADPRIVTVAGRPSLIVDPGAVAAPDSITIAALRDACLAASGRLPYVIVRSDQATGTQAVSTGLCDAVLDRPHSPVPGETGGFAAGRSPAEGIDVFRYTAVAARGAARAREASCATMPVFHTVTVGRDNTATAESDRLVYQRFTVREYGKWLLAAMTSVRDAHPEDRRFVFLDAWNDWNHGCFLEPDAVGGYTRLNETSRALVGIPPATPLPRVSVIVPNYNHERFLAQRLDSIYGQTYRNIEVLLLDDCSTDGSRVVMDRYAEAHPDVTRRIYNEERSGSPFRQWARGLEAATGDLVWIAESDDYCDPDLLERLVACFDDEAVLLATARCVFVQEDGTPFNETYLGKYVADLPCGNKWTSPYRETAHNEVRTALGIKNTIPNASGVVFRRPESMPLLQDEGWRSMRVAGDWVFYLHLLRGGRIAHDSRTSNYFRRYEGSAAEVTYRRDTFYREVGVACRTVAALYDVPLGVLERCRDNYLATFRMHGGTDEGQFLAWFDFDAAIAARVARRPNVMICTMGFYPGGAEILPIRLANEYKRQGLSVLLFNAALNPREDGVRRMVRNDVPVVETSDVEPVRDLIRDFGIEALHTHQWHIQKYPLRSPEVFEDLTTHVASLHGMIEHGDAFKVTRDQLLAADRAVTTWVYTAEKNLAPFRELGLFDPGSPRFTKIPNGMEVPRIVPVPRADMHIPDEAFVLCCVSRAIPDKGWAEMIEVVERARTLSGRDIRLILVGNGPVHDEYCRTGVPAYVHLAGFHENSVGHYASSDMGIMLTKFKSESFPLTVVDCMFAGRPYIASDVGDIPNMLTTDEGVAGAIVPLDAWEVPIERAAAEVAAFATDSARYAKAKACAAQAARRYRIDAVAEQYVQLLSAPPVAAGATLD